MKKVANIAIINKEPIIESIIIIFPLWGTLVFGSGEAKAVNPKPAHPAKICYLFLIL